MKINMEDLHKDILNLRKDVLLIRNILVEEGEITEEANKSLVEARSISIEEYTDLEDL